MTQPSQGQDFPLDILSEQAEQALASSAKRPRLSAPLRFAFTGLMWSLGLLGFAAVALPIVYVAVCGILSLSLDLFPVIGQLTVQSLLLPALGIGVALPFAFSAASWADLKGLTWLPMLIDRIAAVPSVIFALVCFIVLSRIYGMGWMMLNAVTPLAMISFLLLFRVIYQAFRRVSPSERSDAVLLGAGPLQVQLTIALSRSLREILSGILTVYARLLGEVAALFALCGIGLSWVPSLTAPGATFGTYIATNILRGGTDQAVGAASAVTLALMALVVGIRCAANRVFRRDTNEETFVSAVGRIIGMV